MKKDYSIILVFVLAFCFQLGTARTIIVQSGDDLDDQVEAAEGGDTVLIGPGTYGPISLYEKNYSALAPLVIMSDGTGTVTIEANLPSSGSAVDFDNCSYIVIEGVVLNEGLTCFYVDACHHIVIKDNEIKNAGQGGIHIGLSSTYIDMTGNYIHDLGLTNPQWAEGIYVGTGYYGTSTVFPNNCEYIWIENNTLHDCGNGEAINVKGECFHVTVKGNTVYNIAPGTSTQYNQAAITMEGANNSIANSYRLTESRDLWVEENEVFNVSGGYSNWNNGILFAGNGCYVINNTVHDCDDIGIYCNSYATLDLPVYIYNNDSYSNGTNMTVGSGISSVYYTDPGTNPNLPQTWFEINTSSYIEGSATGVSLSDSSVSLYPYQSLQLSATVVPFADTVNPSVTWSSSDVSVARVSSNGLLTAIAIGSTTITVTTDDGGFTAECSLIVNSTVDFDGYYVSASSNDGNIPMNTRDDDLDTKWSASGVGEWIKFDMQESRSVNSLEIAFADGDVKTSDFDIKVSSEDIFWTTLFSGSSSGTSLDLETFDLVDTDCRYIKIVGDGNSDDDWNSITEIIINLTDETGINSLNSDGNGIMLYPNPTVDKNFTIDLSNYTVQDVFKVSIIDTSGRVVYSSSLIGGELHQIGALQSAGLYTVNISTSEQIICRKLIVN